MHMTPAELDALVESKLAERLAARLAAERAAVRDEVVLAIRREAERAHHARINAKHPIESKLAGLTQAQEDERQRIMAERSKATCEKMDRANARVVPGMRAALRPTKVDAAGGSVGFRIKP
jgi:hypothetical protein